jgi:HEAT repeat protein
MKRPPLTAIQKQEANEDASLPVTASADALLRSRATKSDIDLFLREPAIRELARKKDPIILDLCESLLSSPDSDDWLVAVTALAEMKTRASLERLISLYVKSNPEDRSTIVQKVAYCLTSDHASSFEKMLKELSVPCKIDVSSWSSCAKAVLGTLCGRLGLTLTYVRAEQGGVRVMIS